MSAPSPDSGTPRERIIGTWRMLSWKRIVTATGECADALGPSPFGYINYAPDGHLMVFVLKYLGNCPNCGLRMLPEDP